MNFFSASIGKKGAIIARHMKENILEQKRDTRIRICLLLDCHNDGLFSVESWSLVSSEVVLDLVMLVLLANAPLLLTDPGTVS